MKHELIISTYENPRSLDLCLCSVSHQTELPDSICIADDGSGPTTIQVIEEFKADNPNIPLRHIWHEDRGFEKGTILNRAIVTSKADFLIFIDGDVLIHPSFLARHIEMAHPSRFSTGSLIRLDERATANVTKDIIKSNKVFSRAWLKENRALDRFTTYLKTSPCPKPIMALLDRIYPIRTSLCGANTSVHRDNLIAVNGYDETIKYGGEDKELGARLVNSGVRGWQLRFSAPLVHLDHPRDYKDPEKMHQYKALIRQVRAEKRTRATDGIDKPARPN